MPTPASLEPVCRANSEITAFLKQAPGSSPPEAEAGADLTGIRDRLAALMATIQAAGQLLRSAHADSFDASARGEIARYADNLRRLKEYLLLLHGRAEVRRDQLTAHCRKITRLRSWCDAVKLSNLK